MSAETSGSDSALSYVDLLSDFPLLVILLISFTAAFSTAGVSAALPSIGGAFDVSDGTLGLVMTVFFLPLVVAVPVTGVLADIFGRRTVVLPALALVGLTGIATLFVETFTTLLILRGVQGVAYAGTLPMTATLIGDRYGGASGSAAQGMRASTHGFAFTLGPLLAGFLAAITWEYAFLLFALAFPVFGLVYVFYAEPLDDTVERNASVAQIRSEFAEYWHAIRAEASDRLFALLFGSGFVLFVVKRGIWTFIPVYVVESVGLSIAAGGIILSVYGIVQILVPPAVGPIVVRFGRKRGLVAGFAFLAVGTALVPLMTGMVQLGLVIGVIAAGDSLINPLVTDSVAEFASEEYRGGIVSGLTMFKVVANAASPVFLGLVISYAGYREMFLLAAAISGMFGLVVLLASVSSRLDRVPV